ncbi:MAG: pirin family protein, partial [Mycobacterium sp.]
MRATAEIRRAADRVVTKTSWLNSRHSFSFGDHYDPHNTH